jgi:hypothetical protein
MGPEMNLERRKVLPNTVLSDMDKAYMVIHYWRPVPHNAALGWSLENALKVAKVDDETSKRILGLKSAAEIRDA